MRKYYLIFDTNNSLIDVREEFYKHELEDYFNELEQKGFSYKEVSHFKYRAAQNILWEELSEFSVIRDIKRTYLMADIIPLFLKLIILFAVINLLFILLE